MRNAIRLTLVLLPLSLFAGGCDSCNSSSGPTSSTPSTVPSSIGPGTPSASATASAPAPSASVGTKDKMAHCPNAVTGATTVIADVPGGVEITITSKDDASAKDIRARTTVLVDASKNPAMQGQHTGGGGGGGVYGRCPVVMKNTAIVANDIPGGTKITVTAKVSEEVDFLRRETRERQQTIGPQATEGAGERKMNHCPSAVTGATTVVTNSKDAVVVRVTASTDDATKDIRARAKHVLEVSKQDAGSDKHTGEGTGGGGLGRCPVVVKATALTAKDVPGGTEITVKPIDPKGLAALQKESKERAERFSSSGGGGGGGGGAPAPSASAKPASSK